MNPAASRRRAVVLVAAVLLVLVATFQNVGNGPNGLDFAALILIGAAAVYAGSAPRRKRL